MIWLTLGNSIHAELDCGITPYVDPAHDGWFSWKVFGCYGYCLDGEAKNGVVAEGLTETLDQAKMLANSVGSADELFAAQASGASQHMPALKSHSGSEAGHRGA